MHFEILRSSTCANSLSSLQTVRVFFVIILKVKIAQTIHMEWLQLGVIYVFCHLLFSSSRQIEQNHYKLYSI